VQKAPRCAKSKLFHADNKSAGAQNADVHGLRTQEAVRQMEKVLADAYKRREAALILLIGMPEQGGTLPVKTVVTKALQE
jgi:hypothetical protein